MQEEQKKYYENYSKEELFEEIKKLEKRLDFGLHFEEQTEDIVEECKKKKPVLKLIKKRSIKSDKNSDGNILIEGDNYASLLVLNETHKKKVDVIYIDPPYNTGNKDFIYNDNFIDKENSFRHSKWLSFMEKRLKLAKNLLKDDGVIFISIDDNEQANLKLLCDEIFGENNFVANVVVETGNPQGLKMAAKEKTFVKVKEYFLFYSRNKNTIQLSVLYDKFQGYDYMYNILIKNNKIFNVKKYLKDNSLNEKDLIKKTSSGEITILRDRKDFLDKEKYLNDLLNNKYEKVINLKNFEVFKINEKFFLKLEREKSKVSMVVFLKNRIKNEALTKIRGDLWKNFYLEYGGGVKFEGGVNFKNGKKSLVFLKDILKSSSKKKSIILDFFAGSGTTGHAVLDLNKEDGGNRKFILCTNNENKICEEITYERIKRVSKGYTKPNGEKVEGLGGSMEYFKTDFVDLDVKKLKNKYESN